MPVGDEAVTQMLRPSAAQSRLAIAVQSFNVRARSLPPATRKSRISAGPGSRWYLAKASVEPSGERVQLYKYQSEPSNRLSGRFSPFAGSKIDRFRRLAENSLTMHTLEGDRAH